MATLYLVDGHAHAYQQFFALGGLTAPDGRPTGAVFGVVRLLKKLLEEQSPDYIALVFDPPGDTFRHELYAQYKADRAPMPDALRPQIPLIGEVAEIMGVPVLTVPRYEADDVIGTLAHQAAAAGIDVRICGKDKDYGQLIGDRVALYDVSTDTVHDAAWLQAERGLTPAQVRDWLALAGDKSDGIPGIPGVGDKTAKKILDQWGSVENALAHASEVKPPKARKAMETDAENIRLWVQLATIATDAPVDVAVTALTPRAADPDVLREKFRELGFRTLAAEGIGEVDRSAYRIVATVAELDALVDELRKEEEIALDTETTSASPVLAELVGVSLCARDGEGAYVPVWHPETDRCLPKDAVVAALNRLCADGGPALIGHNLKYDLTVLANAGVRGMRTALDTMVAAYLCTPGGRRLSLDDVAADHLGVKMIPREQVMGKGKDLRPMNEIGVDVVGPYAAEDADMTWQLAPKMRVAMDKAGVAEVNDALEVPLVPILADMERLGIACDPTVLEALAGEVRTELEGIESKLEAEAGEPVNPRSPKQLAHVLFEKLELPVIKKGKSGPSTDADVLEQLADQHPLPALLLEHRKLAKLLSTYLETLPALINPATARIHTDFGQTVAATGRLSSREPNLQNIPVRTELGRKIRGAFVASAPDRVFLAADYSQVELRMLAHFCEDPTLRQAFIEGRDIHTQVAADLAGCALDAVDAHWRNIAKTVNFGIIYGQTPFGLARQLRISREEAIAYIDGFFARYAGVKTWIDGVIAQARELGEVRTIRGRRRAITDIDAQNRDRRAAAERTAVNTVVQGSAADLIKQAMIDVAALLADWRARHAAPEDCPALLLQIHDELLCEVPRDAVDELGPALAQAMSSAMELSVPLEVKTKVGANWGEL